MVQPNLVPKKRGRPPLLSKPEVPKVQEVPKSSEAQESKSPVEAAVMATPKKRGRPPLHAKPGYPNGIEKVGEPKFGGANGGEAEKGTTSVGNAVRADPKPLVVDSENKETIDKEVETAAEKKKVSTNKTVEKPKDAVVDEKMETNDLDRKHQVGNGSAAAAKSTVQVHSYKRPLEKSVQENPFKWRRTGESTNSCYAPCWPPKSFPVLPVQTHTILMMALCAQCVHETNQRIRIFQPGGKEYIGVVMCQQCIKKNTALVETFK